MADSNQPTPTLAPSDDDHDHDHDHDHEHTHDHAHGHHHHHHHHHPHDHAHHHDHEHDDHDHDHEHHHHEHGHGHTHEKMEHPGKYTERERPLVTQRNWSERSFTIGMHLPLHSYLSFNLSHLSSHLLRTRKHINIRSMHITRK